MKSEVLSHEIYDDGEFFFFARIRVISATSMSQELSEFGCKLARIERLAERARSRLVAKESEPTGARTKDRVSWGELEPRETLWGKTEDEAEKDEEKGLAGRFNKGEADGSETFREDFKSGLDDNGEIGVGED